MFGAGQTGDGRAQGRSGLSPRVPARLVAPAMSPTLPLQRWQPAGPEGRLAFRAPVRSLGIKPSKGQHLASRLTTLKKRESRGICIQLIRRPANRANLVQTHFSDKMILTLSN